MRFSVKTQKRKDMKSLNFDLVLKRLYEQLEIEKDIEFSRLAGVAQNTISTWKKRKQIPIDVIAHLAAQYDFSIDYILFGRTHTILDDFIAMLGAEKANEELHRHLIFHVLEKFRKENLPKPKIFGELLEHVLHARPLLFLYYILFQAKKNPKKNPKKTLVDALHATHFSRWTFGPEMSNEKIKKYEEYILYEMSEEEAKVIVDNIPATLQVLESIMPSAMVSTHRKLLERKKED
jgi:transcriptional regulator with XRE-family HTH domain